MPKGVYNRNHRDMSRPQKLPAVAWSDPGFKAFGDRLDFLSPEAQHLQDGKLRILPARSKEVNE